MKIRGDPIQVRCHEDTPMLSGERIPTQSPPEYAFFLCKPTMTEQECTNLFLLEQYRPEPHAVKASDTEMTNLPSATHTTDMNSKGHATYRQ